MTMLFCFCCNRFFEYLEALSYHFQLSWTQVAECNLVLTELLCNCQRERERERERSECSTLPSSVACRWRCDGQLNSHHRSRFCILRPKYKTSAVDMKAPSSFLKAFKLISSNNQSPAFLWYYTDRSGNFKIKVIRRERYRQTGNNLPNKFFILQNEESRLRWNFFIFYFDSIDLWALTAF
jgi:hypothetical protein